MTHFRALLFVILIAWTGPVFGQTGANYPFKVAPIAAFAVLEEMPSSHRLKLSPDEARMLADVKDGKFASWSLAEASLLASGLKDAKERKQYLAKIDALAKDAAEKLADAKPFEKGDKLLKLLHATTLKKYSTKQTNIHVIFDNGQFNCVSSAILFNILADRLGLEAHGVLVSGHMFSKLYDGAESAPVETTNKAGFNPEKPKKYSRPREVKGPAMLAAIYNNHATEMVKAKRLPAALQAVFSIMVLDPADAEAAKQARALLVNIGMELAKAEKYDDALQSVTVGLRLAPADRALLQNQKYFQMKLTQVRN